MLAAVLVSSAVKLAVPMIVEVGDGEGRGRGGSGGRYIINKGTNVVAHH